MNHDAALRVTPWQWILSVGRLARLLALMGLVLAPYNAIRVRGSVTVGDVPIFLLGALLVGAWVTGRMRLWVPTWVLAALGLALLAFLLENFTTTAADWGDFVGLFTYAFCLFLAPLALANTPGVRAEHFPRLLAWWCIANVVGAAAAACQARGIGLGPLNGWLQHVGARVAGFTLHPNTIGQYCSLAMPVALALALEARRALHVVLWLAALVLLLHAVDLSGSRTGLVAGVLSCAFVIGLYAWQRLRQPGVATFARITMLALASLAALQLQPGSSESAFDRLLGDSASSEVADTGRARAEDRARAAFERSPLYGEGFNRIIFAHNHWLETVESGGVLALAGYAIREVTITFYVIVLVLYALRGRIAFVVAVALAGLWLNWLASGFKQTILLDRNASIPVALVFLCWMQLHGLLPERSRR